LYRARLRQTPCVALIFEIVVFESPGAGRITATTRALMGFESSHPTSPTDAFLLEEKSSAVLMITNFLNLVNNIQLVGKRHREHKWIRGANHHFPDFSFPLRILQIAV
jgi:hypothetical protein